MKNLNDIANTTGYVATETPKMSPRLIIKNVPNYFIPTEPTEICQTIAVDNPSIGQLIENNHGSLKHVITLKPKKNGDTSIIIEVSPNVRKIILNEKTIRFGLCVYDVSDHIRITQCYKCNKFGHSTNSCKAPQDLCGICGLNHKTRACQQFEIRINDKLAYMNDPNKKCLNCCASFKHKSGSTTHGAIDLNSCPLYKVQIERAKERINYDASHHFS
jgi:hypothetical protein